MPTAILSPFAVAEAVVRLQRNVPILASVRARVAADRMSRLTSPAVRRLEILVKSGLLKSHVETTDVVIH